MYTIANELQSALTDSTVVLVPTYNKKHNPGSAPTDSFVVMVPYNRITFRSRISQWSLDFFSKQVYI